MARPRPPGVGGDGVAIGAALPLGGERQFRSYTIGTSHGESQILDGSFIYRPMIQFGGSDANRSRH